MWVGGLLQTVFLKGRMQRNVFTIFEREELTVATSWSRVLFCFVFLESLSQRGVKRELVLWISVIHDSWHLWELVQGCFFTSLRKYCRIQGNILLLQGNFYFKVNFISLRKYFASSRKYLLVKEMFTGLR